MFHYIAKSPKDLEAVIISNNGTPPSRQQLRTRMQKPHGEPLKYAIYTTCTWCASACQQRNCAGSSGTSKFTLLAEDLAASQLRCVSFTCSRFSHSNAVRIGRCAQRKPFIRQRSRPDTFSNGVTESSTETAAPAAEHPARRAQARFRNPARTAVECQNLRPDALRVFLNFRQAFW